MAKNGVDGVYTADPKENSNAELIKHLTFSEIAERGLEVMDKEAAEFLSGNNIEAVVFNMDKIDNLLEILEDDNQNKTIISK
jgi:uridylate kinase